MQTEFQHATVLLSESVDGILGNPDGIYVDCTLGGGGHSAAILSRLSPQGLLIGIDQDPAAVIAGQNRLSSGNAKVQVVQGNFSELDTVLDNLHIEKVDGILFDLGVSSHQIDLPQRGFSYMKEGPLDMRMDPTQQLSAQKVVNSYSEAELSRIFFDYGEERWAKRIAKFIVEARQKNPLTTTTELVAVIMAAIPAAVRRQGSHPAKRTFQAIRIEVNGELQILPGALKTAIERLTPGGKIGVISFHSLEDRIVKNTFSGFLGHCICPPKSPVCTCNPRAILRLCGKPVLPSAEEIESNPRAHSAKLRIAEKVKQGGLDDGADS
ncbi:MAG TPA: 16S rRNA (cytosine(1402)-N(4))-methyltransferase RsmH [Negativicutes bacterium]|nr:16S rRNA (cytosine(1402)-N(4))-methyltransferase RsmH [Negativicutes bacterium]